MNVSEARMTANRQNSLKSTGPKTSEGKERSRQNGLKHGMTGLGVVLGPVDAAEVERREQAFRDEMAPRTMLGAILIRQLATLSVRMELGSRHEFAAIASRVRHAEDAFDQARLDRANAWFDSLAESPARIREQLVRMPEGIANLIAGFRELRAELTHEKATRWSKVHLGTLLNLMGLKADQGYGTRLEAIAVAAWGFLGLLQEDEKTAMPTDERKKWAAGELGKRIDAEIAGLEAHRTTIDRQRIALDRAEAVERALFDASPEARLAHRYEAEARRAFFKTLQEFRLAEEQSAPQMVEPEGDPVAEEVASSRRNLNAAASTGQTEVSPTRMARPDPSRRARDRKNHREKARSVVA